jgi:hypothetical protein
VLGGNSDPIRESLAKALGHPLPNVVYAGGEKRFRPIVESFRQELAAEAGTAAGCDFVFNAFYLLLERLVPIEPLFQAPCERETAVLERIYRESEAVSYGRMLQFYVSRALSVLHYGALPTASRRDSSSPTRPLTSVPTCSCMTLSMPRGATRPSTAWRLATSRTFPTRTAALRQCSR